MQFIQDSEATCWVKSALDNVVAAPKFDCLSMMLYGNIPYRETLENYCTKDNDPPTFAPGYKDVNGTWTNIKLTNFNLGISPTEAATIQGRYGK